MKQTNSFRCPKCNGRLKLRNGRNGAFLGCEMYPTCNYTTGEVPGFEESHLENMTREKAMHVMLNGFSVISNKTGEVWKYENGCFWMDGVVANVSLMLKDGYFLHEKDTSEKNKNSKDLYVPLKINKAILTGVEFSLEAMRFPIDQNKESCSQEKDLKLAQKLIKAGPDHAKFTRGIILQITVEMQIGFMIEMETYRHGVEILSTSSSMHNELKGLSGRNLAEKKQKDLPYKIYKRSLIISYQALRAMYKARRNHRHPDWQIFCNFIEKLPYFEYLIYPEAFPKSVK